MGRGWSIARSLLGLGMCTLPRIDTDFDPNNRPIEAAASSGTESGTKGSAKSPKGACAICLEPMNPGKGHAIFTAECSHNFHFLCIASSTRHGNLVCPICRATWKEIPWYHVPLTQQNPQILSPAFTIWRRSTTHHQDLASNPAEPLEPSTFDDDDLPDRSVAPLVRESCAGFRKLDITGFVEVSALPYHQSRDNLTVLVRVKAPPAPPPPDLASDLNENDSDTSERAPIDLVTVLDTSGSMAGSKLALLKAAMNFVINQMGPQDRLSIVAFSSASRRVLPLRCMNQEAKEAAIGVINLLDSSGGTNIADGLRKGSRVLEERRHRNSVASIMLLSDGQDTHGWQNGTDSRHSANSFQHGFAGFMGQRRDRHPMHTFGIGADHDPAIMHSIAEQSGGTFSFIEAATMVQDAFARCIGGLLSVLAQNVRLDFSCGTGIELKKIEAGSYRSTISDHGLGGFVSLGDLYAEETRDVLLELKLPALDEEIPKQIILNSSLKYKDSVSELDIESSKYEISISRPRITTAEEETVCLDVDRQRNRLLAGQAIASANNLANQGDFSGAQSVLERAKGCIRSSESFKAKDHLSCALEKELEEICTGMNSRAMYETSGRAYALSAQSSHSQQRMTTRGSPRNSDSWAYQTPTMENMVNRSATFSAATRSAIAHESGRGRNSTSRPPIHPRLRRSSSKNSV